MSRYLVFFHPGEPVPDRMKYVDDATDAPDANDDAATLGVTVGSLWLDTTNGNTYVCHDASTGAAVWKQLGGLGASDSSSLFTDLSVSGALAIDYEDGATQDLTLTGNVTGVTISNALTGKATDIRLVLRQDGTGSRTVDWTGITVTWVGGSAPTLQTDADAVDTIGLLTVDDGTTYLGYHASGGGSAGTPATTVESETTFGISAAVGTDTEYARQDHTHGTPANPVTAAAVKALGRWEPVQYDDGSSPWPFVYYDDEIVVAWVETP